MEVHIIVPWFFSLLIYQQSRFRITKEIIDLKLIEKNRLAASYFCYFAMKSEWPTDCSATHDEVNQTIKIRTELP